MTPLGERSNSEIVTVNPAMAANNAMPRAALAGTLGNIRASAPRNDM
jgi:hypothetical protein